MRRRWFGVLMVVGAIAAFSATGALGDSPPAPPLQHGTDVFSYASPLANVQTVQQHGSPDAGGHCNFAPSTPISHAPGGPAVEQREVSMDYDTCTVTYQVGTPAGADGATPANGSSKSETLPLAQQIATATQDKKPLVPAARHNTRKMSSARRAMGTGDNLDRSLSALTVQAACFCSCLVASSHVARTSRGVL